jgi:hypothetical protein
MRETLRFFPECKWFASMAANFAKYVTEWQHGVAETATTERAAHADPKPLTFGRPIVIGVTSGAKTYFIE